MAFNPSGASGVPLTVFGSWVTETAPTALPEGASPDNQEMMYLPGSAYSRAAFQKLFASAFPAGGPSNFVPTLVCAKSFVMPTGGIRNLFFDSNGALWVQDPINTPAVRTLLVQSTPGSFFKSITAFGREYIAISDGLHGSDIPYEYDGTNLDRVTQDGPAAPPIVTSLSLPATSMVVAGASAAQTVASITASGATTVYEGPVTGYVTFYTTITVSLAALSTAPAVGSSVVIAGNTETTFNRTFYVQSVTGLTFVAGGYYSTGFTSGTGGTATPTSGFTLERMNNQVSCSTAAAHGLKIGYQAQISGMDSLTVGTSITSIVINNETDPGIATVTMSSAHGLLPQNNVTITGVNPVAVGGAIASAVRQGQVVTLTMTTAHSLAPGTQVVVAGVTDVTFDTTVTVQIVPSPLVIVYNQADVDATSSAGTVSVAWPIPDNTPTPTFFEVLSAPTPTTFQVQVSYADGTWSSGTVKFPWNGTFFVTRILSATAFVYQNYGPDGSSSTAGKVTPWGQCAPGLHLCQVLFLLRDGSLTEPSPPTTFISNGGQYVNVTAIPIGPANVVARILAFTGAQPNVPGILPPFFYLAVPAQLEGQVVSTATQIDDNSATTALLDFSDNSLFGTAASGGNLSTTGNSPVDQIIIDGALGFSYSDSRVRTWGQRNKIQNLLNMGFNADARFINSAARPPTGWLSTSIPGTLQVAGAFKAPGIAYSFTIDGNIYQGAYQDYYGDPIAEPNTKYKIRAYLFGPAVAGTETLAFSLSSALTGFNSSVTIPSASIPGNAGGWVEAALSTATPASIPPDLIFEITSSIPSFGQAVSIQELSLIDAQKPYLDNQAFSSYVDNPAAYDGVTGNMQPTEDTSKIMDWSIIRGTLYCHTQDPSGRLHEIIINPTSEPAGWRWKEVASNCGTLSAFAVTHSQADDATAAGGEDWVAWPSEGGALIFDGGEPKKISQEIQPNWNAPYSSSPWIAAGSQVNMAAAKTIQALNDPVEKMLFFFLPIGAATAPSQIYPMSYRELNGAYAIANSPPFHPSLSGRLVSTDNTRKWTHWLRSMNGAARMYTDASGKLTTVFFGGNGQAPGAAAGFGNCYRLNPAKLTDDDYGQIHPYYVTAFFLDPEKAQALGLAFVRLLCCYANVFIAGTGNVTYSVLCDALTNPWGLTVTRALSVTPTSDQEFAGCQALGNRMALKIASSPATGTDNGFNLQRLQMWFKKAKMTIRGAV